MASTRRRRMPAAQRREVILAAAEATFAESGYHGASLDERGPRRRGLEGADLRALRVQARPARLAARRPRGRDLPPPRGRRRQRRDAARSGCGPASTPSSGSSRPTARPGGRSSATRPTPRSARSSRGCRPRRPRSSRDCSRPTPTRPRTSPRARPITTSASRSMRSSSRARCSRWPPGGTTTRTSRARRSSTGPWSSSGTARRRGRSPRRLPAVRRPRRRARAPASGAAARPRRPRVRRLRALSAREGIRAGAQNACRMVVLGIDPGLANTGYGVVARRGGRLVALDGGVHRDAAPASPPERRLAVLHQRVRGLLAEHEPDAVALEDLYFGAERRARAFAVGQARGVVMLAAGAARASRARTTRPSRSRARSAAAGARRRSRSGGWCRRCCGCPSRRGPTTRPTRSPWRSATPTTRRCRAVAAAAAR